MISLDEAVGLAQDEDGILGTDSESEFSENDDDSSLVNHDSDWVSIWLWQNFIPHFFQFIQEAFLLL